MSKTATEGDVEHGAPPTSPDESFWEPMDPVTFANSMSEGIVSIKPLTEEDAAERDTPPSGTSKIAGQEDEIADDAAGSQDTPPEPEGAESTGLEAPIGRVQDLPPEGATGEEPNARAPVDDHAAVVEVDSASRPRAKVADAKAPAPGPLDDLGDIAVEPGEYVPMPLPRIIAVANQKGGVGKTTTAVNLGAALAELGYRVLVIDLDPQANATTGMGVDAHSFELSMYDVLMRDAKLEDAIEPTSIRNLFVAPSTIDLAGAEIELVPTFSRELKLRRALEPVTADFDFTLIDCPPSLGLITVNGLSAATEVLVPIQCEYYALEGLGQLLRNVQLVKANLNDRLDVSTIVLTMYDGRTKLAEQVVEEVRAHFGNKVCRNVIPRTVRLSEAPSYGQPITAFDSGSRGAIAYRELAREVSGGGAA